MTTPDPLDDLDASLEDFEPPPSPLPSEAATTDLSEVEDSEIGSAGGYSPPAWRRLGNGDRSHELWMERQGALMALGSDGQGDTDSGDEAHW